MNVNLARGATAVNINKGLQYSKSYFPLNAAIHFPFFSG
jgi:hypothetical protein